MPDNETKWPKGPWTYSPIPGYQFVVMLENRSGGMKLVASGIQPGKEDEARAALTLAAAAPKLYAALLKFVDGIDLGEDVLDLFESGRIALAESRGEDPNQSEPSSPTAPGREKPTNAAYLQQYSSCDFCRFIPGPLETEGAILCVNCQRPIVRFFTPDRRPGDPNA